MSLWGDSVLLGKMLPSMMSNWAIQCYCKIPQFKSAACMRGTILPFRVSIILRSLGTYGTCSCGIPEFKSTTNVNGKKVMSRIHLPSFFFFYFFINTVLLTLYRWFSVKGALSREIAEECTDMSSMRTFTFKKICHQRLLYGISS